MPELPEVETIVRMCRPQLAGRRVVRFVGAVAKQAHPNVSAVRHGIVGKRIRRVWRRGKYIVIDLEGPACRSGRRPRRRPNQRPAGHLLIHLGMSGRLDWAGEHEHDPHHVRAYFDLDDGDRLLFRDARMFGKIIYAPRVEAVIGHLGVEPLGRHFTVERLARLLRGRSRQLKPLLLDQSVIAGLGNIYADEVLFAAGLHPLTRCDRLDDRQLRRLWRAIRRVLRQAIRYKGTSFDAVYQGGQMRRRLKVYGRGGQPCRRCGTPIVALRVAQRGTHVCPRCQPLQAAVRDRATEPGRPRPGRRP